MMEKFIESGVEAAPSQCLAVVGNGGALAKNEGLAKLERLVGSGEVLAKVQAEGESDHRVAGGRCLVVLASRPPSGHRGLHAPVGFGHESVFIARPAISVFRPTPRWPPRALP